MEDFLSLLAVLVIYLIFAFSKGKKKTAKTKRREARAKGFKTAFDAGQTAQGKAAGGAVQSAFSGAQGRQAMHRDCDRQPIHLHAVRDSEMRMAGEGEDPCHAGGVDTSAAFGDMPGNEEPERSEAMQDLLRGVIMSEILTRPCDRAVLRRNGRRN